MATVWGVQGTPGPTCTRACSHQANERPRCRGRAAESLEQQTATSEVLRVISSSPGNRFHPEALGYIARNFTGCLRLFRSDCSAARFGKFDGVAGSGALESRMVR